MPSGHVVIDLSPAQSPDYAERGIARHTLEFARAVVARHPEMVRHLLVDPGRPPLGAIEQWVEGERTIPLEEWVPRRDDVLHLISPFELEQPLRRLWPRAASAAGTRLVVTVHDLIPEVLASEYLADPGLRRRWRARRGLVRGAHAVLTLSRSATVDVTELLDIPAARVTQIGAGCSAQFVPPPGTRAEAARAVRRSLRNVRCPFVVYNGGADPRKNVERLLVAWSLLPSVVRARWQLVIAGRMPAAAEYHYRVRLGELGVGDEVVLTGLVDDGTLVGLYQGADLMFFPSRYEGYGLPVIEAMACGAPVMAAATSSLVELVATEATFDPEDPPAMAVVITRGLTDGGLRARLLAASARPVPSWGAAADRAAHVYRALGAEQPLRQARFLGPFCIPEGETGRASESAERHDDERLVAELVACLNPAADPPTVGFLLPLADSPWAAADSALADAFAVCAEVDRYGPTEAPLGALGAAAALRSGYDVVVVTLADHPGHQASLDWLLHQDDDAARHVVVVARDRSLVRLYRSLGPDVFAAAWRAHYPAAPLSPTLNTGTALMVRAAVEHCDRYVVADAESARRVALELSPGLTARLVAADGKRATAGG